MFWYYVFLLQSSFAVIITKSMDFGANVAKIFFFNFIFNLVYFKFGFPYFARAIIRELGRFGPLHRFMVFFSFYLLLFF